MSLANEVENLAVNLRDIREAITERGGTVSNTAGFKDLPDAVRSIPAGDSWYDFFWDTYQDNGAKTDYSNRFSGRGWTNETFKPKYDVITTNAYMLFRYSGIVDLGEALTARGKKIIIDTDVLQYTFNSTLLEVIDGIEFEKPIARFDGTFHYSSNLREIKTPIPIANVVTFNGFDGCAALEEIRFNGIIGIGGANGLNLKAATKLSKASIENIIGCLSTTTRGLSITLSGAAVEAAFGSTSSAEWTNLIDTRANWTIVLI